MAEETRRERDERLKNSGREITNGRVDHPVSKYERFNIDSGNDTNKVSRPTSSNTVTRPSTSNTVTRPSTSNTVTRPTTSNTVTRPSTSNTVTRPSTSTSKPVFKDKSLVTINYKVWVNAAPKNSTQVADVVLGDGWRQRGGINTSGNFGVEFSAEETKTLQQIVASLKELGAIFDVMKIIKVKNEFDPISKIGETSFRSKCSYTVTSWGRNKDEVLDILYGQQRNHNLNYSLPVTLTFDNNDNSSEKESLLLSLRDAGAVVEISQDTELEININEL